MSDNSFKSNLLKILYNIEEREKRQSTILENCIGDKLDASFEYYEYTLQNTCKYILSKNPVTILKGITKEFSDKESSN